VLGLSSLLAFALQTQWALRGLESMAQVAILNVTQRVVFLGLLLLLVRSQQDAPRVMLWQGASEILAALACLVLIAPRVGLPIPRPGPLARRIAWESWPIGVGRALRGILYTGNLAVLAYFWSDALVGEYGAAYRIAAGVLMLGTLFGAAVFPSVARACAAHGTDAAELVAASLRVLAVLLVPIVVGGCLLADPIVRLVFGKDYAGAVPALRAMLSAVLLAALSDSFRRTLQSMNRQRDELIAIAAATGLAIPVNLALTPRLGLAGATGAMIVVELALLALLAWVVRRAGLRVGLFASLSRPLAAAGAMGALLFPLRHLPLAVTVTLGAALYFAALRLLGHPLSRDLRMLDVPAPGETPP
jgi:stage V sporulation protein B